MTVELDTDALFVPTTPPMVAPAKPKRCYRHDFGGGIFDNCARCGNVRDDSRTRTNRNNRNRGKGTSRDLAAYLGWQNVEAMGWPWDIQANHGRIQSKRDQLGASAPRARRLIEAIPAGDFIRGLYHVKPGSRLTSGTVTVLLEEWVNWYGWVVPDPAARVELAGNAWLLRLPLPLFATTAGRTTDDR